MTSKKLKISAEIIDKLLADIAVLEDTVKKQGRQIMLMEAQLSALGVRPGRVTRSQDPWWKDPIISFRGSDAGEQANV